MRRRTDVPRRSGLVRCGGGPHRGGAGVGHPGRILQASAVSGQLRIANYLSGLVKPSLCTRLAD